MLLDQIAPLERALRRRRPGDSRLEARIANYELAFRMQTAAPDLIDICRRTAGDLASCTASIASRRPASAGCACWRGGWSSAACGSSQLINNDWDGHGECRDNHRDECRQASTSRSPRLLADLRQRGLLDSTLVVWTGEFGRTPVMQGNQGRDHSPYGFCTWMAGGGIQGGKAIGATDDLAFAPSTTKSTSTTCTPRCFRCWGSTTRR